MNGAKAILLCCFAGVSGCGADASDAFTLYRNSSVDRSMRIHWASFDTKDGDSYNMNNCMMGARVLNANMTARAKALGQERDLTIGFWCEPGRYKEKGLVPFSFEEAFPTDA